MGVVHYIKNYVCLVNNLTNYTDPLFLSLPDSPPPEFVDSLGDLFLSLNGDWSPPGGGVRQVSIVDVCQPLTAVVYPDVSLDTIDPDDLAELVPAFGEARNFSGAEQISSDTSAADCGTVKPLPSDEEKLLVKQMLADALAFQSQPSLPPCPDKKMPDTPVAGSPASVSTGNQPIDISPALPVHPTQVTEHMPHREKVVDTRKSSALATLSSWLNSVSKPRHAAKPERLKHSVRPHPYAQARTDSVCLSKSSDTSAPAPVAAPGKQTRLSPAQYVSVICRVDH